MNQMQLDGRRYTLAVLDPASADTSDASPCCRYTHTLPETTLVRRSDGNERFHGRIYHRSRTAMSPTNTRPCGRTEPSLHTIAGRDSSWVCPKMALQPGQKVVRGPCLRPWFCCRYGATSTHHHGPVGFGELLLIRFCGLSQRDGAMPESMNGSLGMVSHWSLWIPYTASYTLRRSVVFAAPNANTEKFLMVPQRAKLSEQSSASSVALQVPPTCSKSFLP